MASGSAVAVLVAIGIGAWLWIPGLVLAYTVMTKSWVSLLGVPVAVLFYNLGYPLRRRTGSVSGLALAVGVIMLAVGLGTGQRELSVVAGSGVAAWLGNSLANHFAVRAFKRALLGNAKLLAHLWLSNGVRVRTNDGAKYAMMGSSDAGGRFNPPRRK